MKITKESLMFFAGEINKNAEGYRASVIDRDINDPILLVYDFAGPVGVVDIAGNITSNSADIQMRLEYMLNLKY